MTDLRLAPSARRDLAEIWNYTANTWGIDQAESYISALHRDMDRLRDYPELGSAHPSRIADFRKLPSGSHLIFYLVHTDRIEIVRILHKQMDHGARLR